jgi:4-cresol dehydrogenase (hydroxylating)
MSTQAVLPPGVSKKDFEKAVKEYRAIVGDEWVFIEPEELAPYNRLMIPDELSEHQASGAIAPASVEEIQAILKVSNKYKIPLWTVSVGRNFGYGEALPATPGQIVLELRRMNRIIEVDPELGTALVEPGVTFKQLNDYLIEHDIPFWMNKPAPAPILSPLGWTLERGMGYTRYQEQAQNFCGMEVLLADGTAVKTAMGGVENATTWQSYRWGYGPWMDGIFTQSNFGIVTKLGMWLMKKPETHTSWLVGFETVEDIAKAVEVCRDLRMDGVVDNALCFHMSYGVAMTNKRKDIFQGPGAIPEQMWNGMAKQVGILPWSSAGTVFGTKEQVDVNIAIIKKRMEAIGGRFITEEMLPPEPGPLTLMFNNIKMITTNKLSLEDMALFNYRGAGGAWFSPVINTKANEAIDYYRISKKVLDEYGFDFIGGYMLGYSGRHADAVGILLFDRDNPEELKRAKECYEKLIDSLNEAGYAIYRAPTSIMDKTADNYGEAQKDLNARVKHALDPNHILAPGKSGIL